MTKRLMALVLVSCMLACIMPVSTAVAEEAGAQSVSNGDSASLLTNREVTASGECGADITWTLYADGELVISGTGMMPLWTRASDVPWNLYSASITTVTIEENITRIGDYAFASCINLQKVTLPDSLEIIRDYAFHYCNILTEIEFKEKLYYIGAWAFNHCLSLTSISLPDSVTHIGAYAFRECISLETAEISKGVSYIDNNAFYSCVVLNSINVHEDNQYYASVDGVLFDKNITKLINYPEGKAESAYSVPETVKAIGDYAFFYRDNLESIVLPKGLETIGYDAFGYCMKLAEIEIPASVTQIDEYAFFDCFSLAKATFYSKNAAFDEDVFYNSPEGFVMYGYAGSTAEAYAQEYGHTFVELREITDSGECGDGILWTLYADGELVISGTGDAFEGVSVSELPWYSLSSSVRTVTLDSGVTGISKAALESWDALESFCVSEDNASFCAVDGVLFDKNKTKLVSYPSGNPATSYAIPEGTMSIGDQAFCKAKNLENIVIPNGVERIGNNAFDYCSSLTSIEIPSSVVAILSNPFHECVSLERIEVSTQNSAYSSENGVLFDKQKTKLICYPPLKSDAAYTVPNGVVSVGGLSRCKNLKSIVFPKSVESIDSFALYGASSLEKATVLNANTRFLTHCFYGTAASFELRGHEGSTAETYAEANGHTFVALPSTAVAGDLDGNYDVNKDDAVYIMMHIFFEDIYPITQDADFNGDGEVNKDDAVYVMMHIFFPDTYPIE